jgi:hypothetical protein
MSERVDLGRGEDGGVELEFVDGAVEGLGGVEAAAE